MARVTFVTLLPNPNTQGTEGIKELFFAPMSQHASSFEPSAHFIAARQDADDECGGNITPYMYVPQISENLTPWRTVGNLKFKVGHTVTLRE